MQISTTTQVVEIALERLEAARRFTLSLIDSMTDDQLIARAGGAGNHAIWVMGHLAHAEDQIHGLLTGKPLLLEHAHHELFQSGSIPLDDPLQYPDRQQLLTRMEAARSQTEDWVRTLDGDAGLQPSPEAIRAFAPTAIATAFAIAMHEFMHTGQVASVRSFLGLPPVFR